MNPIIKTYISYLYIQNSEKFHFAMNILKDPDLGEDFLIDLLDQSIENDGQTSSLLKQIYLYGILNNSFYYRYKKKTMENIRDYYEQMIYNRTMTRDMFHDIFHLLKRNHIPYISKLVIEKYYINIDKQFLDLLLTFQ